MINVSNFIQSVAIIALTHSFGVSCSLSGNQGITTNYYSSEASALDTNPVFCGVLGSDMDINRITAVQGLTQSQCGTCLKVVNSEDTSKVQYVMALDRGGVGLDINEASFMALFNGQDTGIFEATWEPTDDSNCAGIVTGGNYPFARAPKTSIPNPITETVEQPQANSYQSEYSQKIESQSEVTSEVQVEQPTPTSSSSLVSTSTKIFNNSDFCKDNPEGFWFCVDDSTLGMCADGELNSIRCSGNLKCLGLPAGGGSFCSDN